MLLLSAIVAVAWYGGWMHRLIWHLAEHELAKAALNHGACRLTIGALEYDLLRGRVWASNVIVHSPEPRAAWKWASPVLARAGKVYVETNLVYVLLSMCFLWEEPPLEVYTLHVSDVQCFVERKHNVFNIHLLDPRNVIPDPSTFVENNNEESTTTTTRDSMVSTVDATTTTTTLAAAMDESMEQQQTLQDEQQDHQHRRALTASSNAVDLTAAATAATDHDGGGGGACSSLDAVLMENDQQQQQRENSEQHGDDDDDDDVDNDKEDEQTAQRLVNDMFLAVESLGQAVQQGSLPRAWNEQRQQIAQRLKQMVVQGGGQRPDDSTNNSNSDQQNNDKTAATTTTTTTTKNASKAMKQGVRLVQHVSKAVVEKTQSVQKVVLPPRRAPRQNQKIVYARFGRVVIDDVRVFTRNYKSSKSKQLILSQQQMQQQHRMQLQQQQQQAAVIASSNGDSLAAAAVVAPSSPERAITGTTTTATTEPLSPPATPTFPSSQQEAQSAATPTTSLVSRTTTSVSSSTMKEHYATAASSAASAASLLQYSSVTSAWNKPIVVKRCAVRASEFCPPLNAKEGDETSPALPYSDGNFVGFPVLYQPIEKCMDAILKRVVADMAKANNGRIFQTALGEVLDYWSTLETTNNNGNADLRNSGTSTSERVD
jgi:hypothetical protein